MTPFTRHKGIAAPLLRPNVDTDQIIPSREMKTVSRKGLAEGLFAGWRYGTGPGRDRTANREFVLNRPEYAGATVLLSGSNFGCGSSREHAVWALAEFGIRAIVAPSFGEIFQNNCHRNGLLPVMLDEQTVQALAAQVEADPRKHQLEIDLEARELIAPDGTRHGFEIEDGPRAMLLGGLDAIGLTQKLSARIEEHIVKDRSARPWAYLDPRPGGRP